MERKIKIFFSPAVRLLHSLIFEVDERWLEVQSPDKAHVIVILDQETSVIFLTARQTLVVLTVFHVDHDYILSRFSNLRESLIQKTRSNNVIIVTMNKRIASTNGLLYLDYLFERQKMYCIDYDSLPLLNKRTCTRGCTRDMYTLVPFKLNPIKKFLAPMRVYNAPHRHVFNGQVAARMFWRAKLRSILLEEEDAFVSADEKPLLPHNSNEITADLVCSYSGSSAWFPVSHEYYSKTIVSVYVETLIHSNAVDLSCVTEKTFDPLVQGNFILPFGYAGLIRDIVAYGFKLPEWIDYSYDNIADVNDRFSAFIESFTRLREKSITELTALAIADSDLLEKNRQKYRARDPALKRAA